MLVILTNAIRMNEYSIKDIEILSGIKAHTLRIWEMRYGFIQPERSLYNFRIYKPAHLKIVLMIAFLQRCGHKLYKLQDLSLDAIERKTKEIFLDHQKIEKRILDMFIAYLDMNVPLFELYIHEYIQRKGIEKAMMQLVVPFIEKSKLLNHYEGHYLYNESIRSVLKSFFLSAITASTTHNSHSSNIVIFTTEENNDEIGLDYMYYSFFSNGLNIYRLSLLTDLETLRIIRDSKSIDAFVTFITPTKKLNLEKYFYQYQQYISETPLLVIGLSLETYQGRLPKNIILKKNIQEAVKYFS